MLHLQEQGPPQDGTSQGPRWIQKSRDVGLQPFLDSQADSALPGSAMSLPQPPISPVKAPHSVPQTSTFFTVPKVGQCMQQGHCCDSCRGLLGSYMCAACRTGQAGLQLHDPSRWQLSAGSCRAGHADACCMQPCLG